MSFKPNVAIAPGRTIENEIINLDMTQREFAERLGISEKHLSQLINGKVGLTFEIAQRLEQITSIPASFWNKLEIKYQEDKARLEMEESLVSQKYLLERFSCYRELVKLQLVEDTRDVLKKIKSLCNFLNVFSLSIISEKEKETYLVEKLAFRKSSSNKLSQENLACRIKAGEELVNPTDTEFNREGIPNIIADLKLLTKNQNNIDEESIRGLLNSVGINFLILNHFKEVPVNGISRMYKGKPLIQLSTRQRWLDIFWFTLFHELGHVYNGDLKKEGIIIDGDEKIESDLEKQADIFAQNNLISPEIYQKNILTKHIIGIKDLEEVSNIEGVGLNIIAGRVSHDLTNKQVNIWQLTSPLRHTIKQ